MIYVLRVRPVISRVPVFYFWWVPKGSFIFFEILHVYTRFIVIDRFFEMKLTEEILGRVGVNGWDHASLYVIHLSRRPPGWAVGWDNFGLYNFR